MFETEYKIAPTARERHYFPCALEMKTLDEEGVFAGYASVFHVVDSQHDIILPGAFRQTLTQRKTDIKLLWQHDMREPIGVVEEVREDGSGLYVKARLLLDVARAREAYALLRSGVVSGLSIGYTPIKWENDPVAGVRKLLAVDLWEVSLVTFPANEAARVTVVKQCAVVDAAVEEAQWKREVSSGMALRLACALDKAKEALDCQA